jgi:hypothetical protein
MRRRLGLIFVLTAVIFTMTVDSRAQGGRTMGGDQLVRGGSGPDSRTARAVLESSSIVHRKDPFTSVPRGIKQSLYGLGWLDSTPQMLRQTAVIPSTQFQLTYQDWPLTNGLMAKGWMSGGIPGFYSPPVEPVWIEAPDMENVNARIPNAYWYFQKSKIEIKPPSFNNGQLVAPNFEQPRIIIPRFERPDYDLRGVSLAALKRYPDARFDTLPGGVNYELRHRAQPTGEQAAPRRRFRAASIWDVFDAKNDPRPGDDPEVSRERRRKTYWRGNFNFRDPNEGIDPRDPKPSYSIRKAYQPNYGRTYYPGGN